MSCRRRFLSAPLSRRLRLHSPVSIFFFKKKPLDEMLLSSKSLSLLPLHLFGPVKAQQSQVGVARYQKKKRTSHAKHCLAVLASP